MSRQNPQNASESRDFLAAKYDAQAHDADQMAANANAMQAGNAAANLKNMADRARTYAATARRMNKQQPTAADAEMKARE
jgi:hypothetical protein